MESSQNNNDQRELKGHFLCITGVQNHMVEKDLNK